MLSRRILSFLSIFLLVPLIGAGCTKAPDAATVKATKHVDLTMWAVVDDIDVYDAIIKDWRTQHPNVSVQFRRLRLEEYEDELVNAMADDRGPDIFMIHNTWLGKYQPRILPMPLTTTVAVQTQAGDMQNQAVFQLQTQPTISIRKFKSDYVDTVTKDAIRTIDVSTNPDQRNYQERIMAVPLSVDTLGLYVNKDLLNAAGIATIPTTWDEFQAAVPRLTKLDDKGEILQSGAALGTGYNVEREPDILAALMMQNGTEMVGEDGGITFPLVPQALGQLRNTPPAYQALSFYTDFASPSKEVYTWNAKQPNSLQAFIQGKTAFFLGYSYQLPFIRAQAPKLNLGISTLPQISGNPTANFANYWMWTVSKKTKNGDVAWNLLNFMTKPEEAKKYLTVAKRPAAIKALLTEQLEDQDIGAFASQVLTSKSWYRGKDPKAAEDAFKELAENVLSGAEDIPTAIRNAADKVSQTMR